MTSVSNQLPEKMRRETERFLSRALRTIRQPREMYERLVVQLKTTSGAKELSAARNVSRPAA